MSVYVDDMEAPFGRMIMCHMVADTRAELLEMATRIGLAHKWLQKKDQPSEHFDVCKELRVLAVLKGAKEITVRDTVRLLGARRKGPAWYDYTGGKP